MKRNIFAILCICILASSIFFSTFISQAQYDNTYTNSGNQMEDLIAVAKTQIGYCEGNTSSQLDGSVTGSNNYTKYGSWYGINPGSWCAMFVSWCANQAGISETVIPKHASCDTGMNWFKSSSKWHNSSNLGGTYTPVRGDIVYFGSETNTNDSTHVGIIYKVDSSYIYTIEGNKNNQCKYYSYALSNSYILGYGTPTYSNSFLSPSTYKTGTYTIATSTDPLNMRSGPATTYTKVSSIPKGTEINVTQVSGEWGYTTYSGYSGWINLTYCTFNSDSTLGNYQVTATALNMRSLPSTSGTVLNTLPNGATVSVTQISGDWGYTKYQDISGWICLTYCALAGSTATSGKIIFDVTQYFEGSLFMQEKGAISLINEDIANFETNVSRLRTADKIDVLSMSAITVEMYVYIPYDNDTHQIFRLGSVGNNVNMVFSGNSFYFGAGNSSTGNSDVISTSFSRGTWFHVVGTSNATGQCLYLNGVLVQTANYTNTSYTYDISDDIYLYLGEDGYTYPDRSGTMKIANARLYNYAASSSQVAAMYSSTSLLENPTTPTPTPIVTPTATPTITATPTEAPTPTPIVNELTPKISVSDVSGIKGDTVDVNINISNNPGIAVMRLFLSYDSTKLTLISATEQGLFGNYLFTDNILRVPYVMYWFNDIITEDIKSNGVIVTLKFKINETTDNGVYPISISYDYNNYDIYNCNTEKVYFTVDNGAINVVDSVVLAGDINGDGNVNPMDGTLLARYNAMWSGYTFGVNIVESNCDLNNDGNVNPMDGTILARHNAAWTAYVKLPYVM